jgi:uroporphyrinogen decarboxylase
MNTLLLDVLAGKKVERHPVWLMRQAGRYLPQYLELRKRHSLWALFHDPELAAQVTLMPFEVAPFDAAIVFSDLLVLAEVFGKTVYYPEKGGPYIDPPLQDVHELRVPSKGEIQEKLSYVFRTIQLLKPVLSVPLIGFCGAPFTMLCYLIEGSGNASFPKMREWVQHRPSAVSSALEALAETCIQYIRLQIESGAQAVQVFDSWANLLGKDDFMTYCLPYWKKIKQGIEDLAVPVIFFSRNASQYSSEIASFQPDGISFDEGLPMAELRRIVPSNIAVQGNFSPSLLAESSLEEVNKAALGLRDSVQNEKGIIINLGHGVLPHTPLENVVCFVETMQSYSCL